MTMLRLALLRRLSERDLSPGVDLLSPSGSGLHERPDGSVLSGHHRRRRPTRRPSALSTSYLAEVPYPVVATAWNEAIRARFPAARD